VTSLATTDWDGFGRLLLAVGMVAMLAYLLPSMMVLPPPWNQRLRAGALLLALAALAVAVIATVLWFVAQSE
jgi:hypothetical protein